MALKQATRFTSMETPVAAPGFCYICRAHDQEFFIDTSIHKEYEDYSPEMGAVYVCSECLREMAELAGYCTPEDKAKLEATIESSTAENFKLRTKLAKTEAALDALTDLIGNDDDVPSVLSPSVEVNTKLPEPSPKPARKADSKSAKSATGGGLGDIL